MQVIGGAIITGGARTPLVTSTTGVTPYFEYVLVGAGGGGGLNRGGGGGGGGVLYGTYFPVEAGKTITVTVGSGGIIIGSALNGCGGVGGDTSISALYTSFSPSAPGGGGGGCNTTQATFQQTAGGSGGGGGMFASPGATLGMGGAPSVPAAAPLFGTHMFYGNKGGNGGGNNLNGGGGGGAGARGTDAGLLNVAIPGGVGTNAFSVWCTALTAGVGGFLAGGGGGGNQTGGPGSPGGTGGGGAGAVGSGVAGTANTGGGGGGSGASGALAANTVHGGSGIAMIRYPDTYNAPVSTTGTAGTTSGGFRYYKFTTVGAGTIVF